MTRNKEQDLDLDKLLPQIGEYGRYQKLVLWLICLPACIPCSFAAFNQIFMADVAPSWCSVPELSFLTSEDRVELAIPVLESDKNIRDSCHRFKANWTEILQKQLDLNNSWPTETCNQGWEYNTTIVSSSIVIDFDLVCERSVYPTIALVILNVGSPVGVYIFGYLNDKYGRRLSFFMCLATLITGNVASALASNFWVWTFFRFIVGCTVPAIYQIPFILALEIVGPRYRSLVTLTSCIFYAIGLMILSVITYFIQNWKYLTYATSLPFISFVVFWFYMPESPRWLLAKGEFEKASIILEKMAKINQKNLPEDFKGILNLEIDSQKKLLTHKKQINNPSVFSLCKSPNLRLKTLLITFNWFICITNYVGLNYCGPTLGQNRYLSFFLSSLVEVPSYFLMYWAMDQFGRRWPFSLTMILSGLSAVATISIPQEAVTTILILFLIAKGSISASLAVIYPFAGEIFPTELRGLGLGTAAYMGGLGLIFTPFVTYLGNENLIIPLVILGAMSVFGGITTLRLPETLHQPLPQTVEEAEKFGDHWSIKNCCQCVSPNN